MRVVAKFSRSLLAPPRALARAGWALALTGASLALAGAGPATAQVFFEPFAYRFQIPPERESEPPPMRPREVTEAARMQGFEPAGRIVRNRDVYVFDAQDHAGRPVRVVMDAYEGDVLRVMRRLEPMRRAAPAPRESSRDVPNVIEGIGPDDEAPAARDRDERGERPAAKRAKRELARETAREVSRTPPAASAPRPPARPAPSVTAPVEGAPTVERRRPPAATEPAQTRLQNRPEQTRSDRDVTSPTPAPPLAVTPPAPVRPDAAESPGPIPPPPFMKSDAARPARDAAPPVAPLDEVAPKTGVTPPVPPAPLD